MTNRIGRFCSGYPPRVLAARLGGALALTLALGGCPDDPGPRAQVAPGIFANAFGEALQRSTPEQLATFERGRAVATRRFSKETGLGPSFNVASCAGCHEKPVTGGAAGRYRNFLLVGQQLSDGSFQNVGVNGVQDQFDVEGHRVPTPPAENVMATRNPIPFFGVGLLAEIDEAAILAHADPDDADHDGVSGRPNYDRGFVGRFGRKAQTVSIEGFIRGPLFNHLGVTSNPLSEALKAKLPVPSQSLPKEEAAATLSGGLEVGRFAQAAAPDEPTLDDDGVADPELSEQDLFDLVSFSMLLAPPRPEAPTPVTRRGGQLFEDVGCATCHVPALEGPRGLIPAYTDLLLHDMGPGLADGVPMKLATGSEFRTQPLWGVVAVGPYLHDGRADTLDEAIRWHGGEGQGARDRYVALSPADKYAVIAFLGSLGGASQASAGLLPPGAVTPPVGALGGPIHALTAAEQDEFDLGREVFDRDTFMSGGLGPVFNGDACRSCHFDPIIGGSGPIDTNVIRHGEVVDGAFIAPPFGTISQRFAADGSMRPPFFAAANVTEQRQAPPLFGLGLLDRVPAAEILAREDVDDRDGDGISGCAQVLADGRLGRLGWKAQVPSVAEFTRDAGLAELGVTLPPQPGLTFGATADDDDAPDPEMTLTDVNALNFFIANLAPPKRERHDVAQEDRGEAVFGEVGCDACHVPMLKTADDVEVHAYTDLLLHDVSTGSWGVVDGLAGMGDFRTPPLWGLRLTGPYMHDGRATTIADAIGQHDGEATASRGRYELLSDADRSALLAFLKSL